MKGKFNRLRFWLPGFILAAALVVTAAAVAVEHKDYGKNNDKNATLNVPLDETSISRTTLPTGSFAPIVKKVTPAVVKIVTVATVKNAPSMQRPWPDDQFWRHFFGDQFGNQFDKMLPPHSLRPFREHGLGSGVIVSKDGYILTNNHVVDNATEVKVTLQDGRELTAKVIGRDANSDIAVVKIDAKDLPTLPMADSSKVEVGDIVLAVGNPFGVGQTVTEGIVSATGRGNMGIEDYEDFIQTDAAINPGNSGGALVDINGRLVGINTAILSQSGGYQGVGFAVPSDLARNVMDSLIKYGHVTRGYLGVMIQDVTPALEKEFDLKGTQGALVGDVVPDGPAAKAGLKNGDVISEFNGKKVTDSRRLKLAVADIAPGTTVPMKVLRNGAEKSFEVTLKQLPGSEQLAQNPASKNSDTGTLNGVAVSDLTQKERRDFNVPDDIKGAVVTSVEADSPAAEAGLKEGNVIEEINRHTVKSADDAVRLTENAKDKHTLLRIWSEGGSHFVVVDEGQKAG
jgi:serine protease Do